uniref:Mothers against decapentaplegic homolog n=1 Tax=Rhabditophanes sp. KR3021 TaxID=114890 RepID=A0AC35TJD6_9BILA
MYGGEDNKIPLNQQHIPHHQLNNCTFQPPYTYTGGGYEHYAEYNYQQPQDYPLNNGFFTYSTPNYPQQHHQPTPIYYGEAYQPNTLHTNIPSTSKPDPILISHGSTEPITSSSADPCAHISHVLQCYQQGGECAEFVRKAIESLVKKLKDKRTELDALITAVTSAGKSASGCVTIPKSLDGRLQVAGRKGVPHVVYARIWRWPNVNKGELQKLPVCEVSFDNQDLICINPYHYERIVSSAATLDASPSTTTDITRSLNPMLASLNVKSPSEGTNKNEPKQPFSPTNQNNEEPFLMYGQNQKPSSILNHLPSGMQQQHGNLPSLNKMVNETLPRGEGSLTEKGWVKSSNNMHPRYDLTNIMTPEHKWPDHWCSISYYELDTQIGDTFKVSKDIRDVTIDGGMNTSDAKRGRFCIGALSNVHRCEASEKARLYIGKGIKLSWTPDNCVTLRSMSRKSVFVRSYYLDFENNLIYGSTVHKFCPGVEKKIFDLRWGYAEMKEQTRSAQIAVMAQACAVAGLAPSNHVNSSLIERAGTGVDDLRRVCCTISISFVKGWGPGYNRSSIKETPCWVEMQLTRPLQLLDKLLNQAS